MADTIQIEINTTDASARELLIARLSQAGADGFLEEKEKLFAYINAALYSEGLIKQVLDDIAVAYSLSTIREQNWNALWESDFKPVVVEDFCAVRASFHEPIAGVAHDIVIDPKMSFGTGHHATTWMMIKAMQGLDIRGKTVFDFGTGTGILAILAEKLGAQSVVAVDNDEWSIRNSIENFKLNNCPKIAVDNQSAMPGNQDFDFVLANINRQVLVDNLFSIGQHMAPGGVLIMSGFLAGDIPVLTEKAALCRFELKSSLKSGGWICLTLIKLR